jgi:hypothetical protein
MNWGKLLANALIAGVVIKSVADIDSWLDEKIAELEAGQTAPALVEMAYEIAKMDAQAWNYLVNHLQVKMMRNEQAKMIFQYCNYVVGVENNYIKDLLSYPAGEGFELLTDSLQNMKTYEFAAHYGVLKAYAESSVKARVILGRLDNALLS